jgi:hypothetical protein
MSRWWGAVEDQMVPLAVALPVLYTVLEQKHVGRTFLPGRIVRLSARQAEIDGAEPVVPLANVKITVLDDAGAWALGGALVDQSPLVAQE